jgi:hypothetical protein
MGLSEQQRLFTKLVGQFIDWSYGQGYALTFGEAYRTPEQAALNAKKGIGIANSLHTERLAVDFNLFKDGMLQSDSAAYKPLGDYWKTLNSLCCWGGDFSKPDGDHFSMAFGGRK